MAGLLCYLGAWITGIVFLAIEKESKFVKFHAMQSLLTFLPLTIIGFVITFAVHLWWASLVVWIIMLILWLILMLKAYQGERFKLPGIGSIAERQAEGAKAPQG